MEESSHNFEGPDFASCGESPPPPLLYQDTQSSPPQFCRFTHLPPELRFKIYIISLPLPRLVPFWYQSSTSTISPHKHHYSSQPSRNSTRDGCTSTSPIPALLRVSHEARALALRYYAPSFQLTGSICPAVNGKILFDKNNDVLFLRGDGLRGGSALQGFLKASCVLERGQMEKVRWIAVAEEVFCSGAGDRVGGGTIVRLREFWECIMRRFGGVEGVWVVGKGKEGEVLKELEKWGEGELDDNDDENEEEAERERMEVGMLLKDPGWKWLSYKERRRGDSFQGVVAGVVDGLERECRWKAPRWEVLRSDGGSSATQLLATRPDSRTGIENEEQVFPRSWKFGAVQGIRTRMRARA